MKAIDFLQNIKKNDPQEMRGVKARFYIVFILLFTVLVVAPLLKFEFVIRPLLLLGLASFLSNVLCILWIAWGWRPEYRVYFIAVADFLILTIAFHYLGGIEAPLPWIYVVALIAYASLYGIRIGIFAAAVCSLMYSSLLVAEFKAIIPHVDYEFLNPVFIHEDSFYLNAKLLTDNALFFIAAIVAGGLAGRLIRIRNILEAQNRELGVEIAERKRIEEELREHREDLQKLVAEQTTELAGTVDRLSGEIKERKQTEERLKILFEFAPDAYYLSDLDGTFIDANKAAEEITGYRKAELIGKGFPALNMLSPDQIPRVTSLLAENALGRPTGPDEFLLHRKDGSQVAVEIMTYLIRVENQPLVLGIARDITERKRAEEERRRLEAQIQHAQKLESLGVLAGGIAHDFNNLLTGILGNAQLALIDLSSFSPARRKIDEIERAAERAADLCNQMLAYSGKGRFVIEPLNLNDAVHEMAHLLEISISKKAALRFNLAGNLPAIEADATQIRQVIMNLITNASEALGENNGIISISTGAMECDRDYLTEAYLDEHLDEGTYVYLEVSDSGCGMDKETQSRIFDPFFTTKFTGRGLGLAAVLGIVRGHKGTVKIYSEQGKGTTFKILFPAVRQPVEPRERTSGEESDWSGNGTVLIVDDEEMVRTTGKSMLEESGFAVLTAHNGREAVDIFRENANEIVLVLLDLTMPHMSGEEAFLEIKRIRADIRIILCSGYNEQDVSNRFVGKGLAGFIQKPYRYQTLRKKIREALMN